MAESITIDSRSLAVVAQAYARMAGPAVDAAIARTLPALASRLATLTQTLIKDATPVGKPVPPDAKTPPWVAQLQSRRGGLRDSTATETEMQPTRQGQILSIITRQTARTASGIPVAAIVRQGRGAITAKPGHALLIPNLGFRTHAKAVPGDDYIAGVMPELRRQVRAVDEAYAAQLIHDLYDTAKQS